MKPPFRSAVLAACALGALAAAASVQAAPAQDDAALMKRVDAVLGETPLIDGHNDLPVGDPRRGSERPAPAIDLSHDTSGLPHADGPPPLMTDIPRLRAGHVGGQFWSVWIPADVTGPKAVEMTIEQIDLVKRMAANYPDVFEMAYTAAGRARASTGRQDRLHDRHRGRPPDRRVARRASPDVRRWARAT